MKKKERQSEWIYYEVFLLVGLIYGLLFELNIVCLIIVEIVYALCVPRIIYNQKKYVYERNRFQDINSYMSQMAQSFIYTNDVILSLEETSSCFTTGLMSETLNETFEIIEEGRGNIKLAEQVALAHIESKYDCEKLRNLHMFFLNAEEIGGECQKEFHILESMRIAWQGVVEQIRRKKVMERNLGVILYAFFLIICISMLHIMRNADLDIVKLWPTQLIDMAMLIGFIIFFVFMDNRLSKSFLSNAEYMSEEEANGYLNYLENYDAKAEQKRHLPLSMLSIVCSLLLIYIKPGLVTVAMGMGIIFVGFHIHTILHVNAIKIMREEIGKSFPRWLFDVMLLLQRESVEGAIEKSIETAPPVLKRDLYRIIGMLNEMPHNPDAYMSFLRTFNLQDVNEIMHKLYSLAVGTNRDNDVLDVVIEKNIKNLERAERDSMLLKDSIKTFTWIPFVCMGFGCAGYMVIAITTTITSIIELIQ